MIAPSLPFDHVLVRGRKHTVDEFLEIPLSQRVKHLLNREVAFFQGDSPVNARFALSQLRNTVAASGKP